MMKPKHLGIRIDPQLHAKLHYIARYEGRSANGQILYLVRQCVRRFEQEHGAIPAEPSPPPAGRRPPTA